MELVRHPLRWLFDRAEMSLGAVFPPSWNPLVNLGALGFFFYWIITASGIYIYIFFDTGVHQAFDSVEYMTHEQWYVAGVMRSLHRYASDGLVVVMLLHLLREWALDRYRGVRWFSWMIGVPILVLVYVAGITGYWLVWDRLAQYVAIVSTEWLDKLPFFAEPVARNFLAPDALESRFFTLMIFMHIAVPLITLVLLWVHLQRITKPKINPPRGLMVGVFLSLLALSLVHPALSQGPADLARVPGALQLDWFYLVLYPLLEHLPGPLTWGAAVTLLIILVAMPWLPPVRKPAPARVDLANCNGCARCAADCPYAAIAMVGRSDGLPFSAQAQVDPSLCVACGICAGACPTSMPFRRASALVPGIDLPEHTVASLRDEVERVGRALPRDAPRVLVFGCRHGVPPDAVPGAVPLACIGQLPPAFIDYVLSKDLAEGVLLTGCRDSACYNRFGIDWTKARLAGTRDPHLRRRVPQERVRTVWAGRLGSARLAAAIAEFRRDLATAAPLPQPATPAPQRLATSDA
jgi:quinol-cytochrome oxidoreductase complex cytochrome b subunit/coenzyme F420-reducing hydrogenase delta subunit